MKIIELFGGIGACSAALKRLGIDYEIADYVEIDKYAVASYNAINGTNFEPQDITKWDKDFKDIDLIMHGSPCQDFSLAGKNKGGDQNSGTRSSLMYETLRIVSKIKPKYVVWENVKNLLSEKHRHNFDNYLNEMSKIGYYNFYSVLNAKDYGIPQNRERVFTVSIRKDLNVAFEFPKPYSLEKRLKDFLEPHVDEKYFLSDEIQSRFILDDETFTNNIIGTTKPDFRTIGQRDNIYNVNGVMGSLVATDYKQPKQILILEKTKKGYTEAQDEDGVYINRPHQKRGVVQKGMIQTIKTSPDIGVVVKNEINAIGNYSPSGHDASRIVHPDGIAPTVKENHGTITATIVKTKNKRIHKIIEDNDLSDKDPSYLDIYNQKVIPNESGTLKAGMDHQQGNIIYNQLRIRKLTPKECWRLMGFNDEEYEKASKVNSNTQLYKQAGNSIVVNVLMEIFKNLLLEKTNNETIVQLSIFDFI